MAQSSGPIAQGTNAERQLTDVTWRDMFGDEPGVVGDMDGSSYALALPSSSDVASVGSPTQVSTARVAGFVHRIPAASPEGITIPVASGSARTDILALRYDPAFTGLPGPVRLTRIPGTTAALPTYDAGPPGVEDMPLWGITRQPGQSLSQATVTQLFPRLAPALSLADDAALPLSSPLGTVVFQGTGMYRRVLVSGTPAWARALTNNAGTSGLPIAGSAPPAGTPLLIKTIRQQLVTNGNGDAGATFPGGAFPNGVLTASVMTATEQPFFWVVHSLNNTLAQASFRGYNITSGTVAGSQSINAVITVIGW